ncbi:DUF4936 family protein [Pandoraea nosoerga]|uniref:DUF4936 domain-containing protein n=1 Tax=Pandoraea nosoerga TaxID=2508296 RepID=A0A5E4SEY0_9BURK|nr:MULTISPECIES: DUF4936 family protein [Pandoraea]MBN4665360.1 DUF4936 family protein [Pandoraea nosoerga]MBN4674760.1 DUF4936 family protein [Pandoraea nosoerga]MBN4680650.1 DUF4936 family protein [Pandoraea nosoerga]MBN4744054.1 DUF4936 family protein [Pandoraea nosoerga]VVD73855.1 hypothetical protein PNO31109_00724 [Pandoraea nosoerga]
MDCYVYYRVPSCHAAAARQAVARCFALVAERFGVGGRLQWRADASANDAAAGALTWMERYDGVDAAFVTALPELARECGLAALIEGGLHIECFVDAPSPCA